MSNNQTLALDESTSIVSNTSRSRYTKVAIILHWAIAALIIFNLVLGLILENFQGPARMIPITLHMSAGLSVLLLTVIRIFWRILNPPPAYPDDMQTWERHASHLAHFFLYVLMVVIPVTGWMIVSANPPANSAGGELRKEMFLKSLPPPPPGAQTQMPPKLPPQFTATSINAWFFIPVPFIEPLSQLGAEPAGMASQKVIHDKFIDWHMVSSYLMILLLLIHVLAALKHQFIDKHAELQRMGVGRSRLK